MARFFDNAVRKPMLAHVPAWIHPNHLTVLRALLFIPVILARDIPWLPIGLIALSSAFDILDGPLARARKQKSELGAVLDPAADKVFVLGVLFGACWHRVDFLVIVLVTLFEVALILLRPLKKALGARSNANKFGAAKTWCQSLALGFALAPHPKLAAASTYLFGAAIAFAICSFSGHLRDILRRL